MPTTRALEAPNLRSRQSAGQLASLLHCWPKELQCEPMVVPVPATADKGEAKEAEVDQARFRRSVQVLAEYH